MYMHITFGAMVLVWTGLAGGDGDMCAIIVCVNSVLQVSNCLKKAHYSLIDDAAHHRWSCSHPMRSSC
jgi:ACR3 family arsenite efflux pump ArsB